MKKLLVAFDVDGTLVSNGALSEHEIVANERIRTLLIIMAHMKNTKIMVWSGGGELWARQAVRALGLEKYVDCYADKQYTQCQRPECVQARKGGTYCKHHVFATDIRPDIAIDDIQECTLGELNLIVREK
jgi:phosphoserine phosphatase